ncbi:MAG: hypothetical protein Q9213_006604 [Squamulea squamosa]
MASSAALSESMQRITSSKSTVLKDQHTAYEKKKQATLDAVQAESELSNQLQILLDALILHDVPVAVTDLSTGNVTRFLNQRRNDPSVSTALLQGWKIDLERCLDMKSHKYEYASLFGQLVTEWLEKPNHVPALQRRSSSDSSDDGSQDSFEPVGRQEMYDQRRQWELLVFDTKKKSNPETIKTYLSTLFGSTTKSKKLTKSPLENLRVRVQDFDLGVFDMQDVRWCIKGLLQVDLLSPTKRVALSDIKDNELVLQEMVDVLNIQLEDLDSWRWGDKPVAVELRRQVNGKYRVYMDEEILQALLLQFIGVKWAVHLKDCFVKFYHSGAWTQSSYRALDRKARSRREGFLGNAARATSTVRNERRTDYERDYFLTQLPSTCDEGIRGYADNGWVCANDDNVGARKVPADWGNNDVSNKKAPAEIKQSLLHLVTTESLINTSLYGSFTILQSDFEWFGPSLPHSTIFTVLEFFGVRDQWLKFFRKFLEAPLKFTQDGPDAATMNRTCGIPIEHALSDALGEAVLFVLDFAVNQATQANLYRFHDDLWFWGQEDVSVKAWETIEDFSTKFGLSLNPQKTGAVQITEGSIHPKLSKSLPRGEVHWGFLTLDSSGQWVINDQEVDKHIEELRRQLLACKSVFAIVQAWNVYVSRFLANNFGRPQTCLGQRHIDMVINTFDKIQQRLFSESFGASSMTDYLKRVIAERFNVKDIMDGFLYFPSEIGGLDLRNPLIPLLLVREVEDTWVEKERRVGYHKKQKDPKEWIQEAFEMDEAFYETCKKRYDEGNVVSTSDKAYRPKEDEPFMSLEEFNLYREETSTALLDAYRSLREEPRVKDVEFTSDVLAALKRLPDPGQTDSGIHSGYRSMTSYYKWVAQLYAGDVLKKFGGLSMGEKKLLPIGLVTMLKGEKVRWQG